MASGSSTRDEAAEVGSDAFGKSSGVDPDHGEAAGLGFDDGEAEGFVGAGGEVGIGGGKAAGEFGGVFLERKEVEVVG